jgi:alpha-mannosidase
MHGGWGILTARDVDSFHLEKQKHLKLGQVSILDHGPLRATLGATVMLGQSKMEVEVSCCVVL